MIIKDLPFSVKGFHMVIPWRCLPKAVVVCVTESSIDQYTNIWNIVLSKNSFHNMSLTWEWIWWMSIYKVIGI